MELACIEFAWHILYMFIMYMNLGNICIVVARLIWCWICLVEANSLLQTLERQADKVKTRASLSSRRRTIGNERLETSWISHPLCQQENPIKVTLVAYNFKLKSEHHWQWTSDKKCSYTASVIHIWSWALSCRRMFRTSSPSGSWSNWSSITLTEKSTLRIKRFHDFIERVSKFYYTSSSVSLRGISMDVAILKVGLAQWNGQVILHKMSLTVRY